jgi:hypothetical protein
MLRLVLAPSRDVITAKGAFLADSNHSIVVLVLWEHVFELPIAQQGLKMHVDDTIWFEPPRPALGQA